MAFFNLFPQISYSLSGKKYPDYQTITNLLFRTAFIQELVNNTSAYIKYTVREADTPEILAAKVYGDPTAYWIITYANNIVDPQFDWPLNTIQFSKYIVDKYRSIAEADTGTPLQDYQVIAWTQNLTNPNAVHHYEYVIKRENQTERTTTEFRYEINKSKLTNNNLTVPFEYYDALPDEQGVTPINLQVNGQTIIQTEYRNSVTYYDYELAKNEAKREIRIIKSEFYPQIIKEFEALTSTTPTFFRRVG